MLKMEKNKIYSLMETYNLLLKEDINLEDYLDDAYKAGFDSKPMAMGHIRRVYEKIKALPDMITLYRVVFVDSPEEIDRVKIGKHYVLKKSELESSHYAQSHVGKGEPYMLIVKAPKSIVDVEETMKNNVLYPHEKEITLKNDGVGANIVLVKPFQPSETMF
jgi:hypothetical protein